MNGSTHILEQMLCYTSLLAERLLFYLRNFGQLPRTMSADDPLGSLCISDEDVRVIMAGFRRIDATAPSERRHLLTDPLAEQIAEARARFDAALSAPDARTLGFVRLVEAVGLEGPTLDLFCLAVAPELDARFGRVFGFLNNDAGRRRPTVGQLMMAADPWFPGLHQNTREALADPLLRYSLVRIQRDEHSPEPQQIVTVPAHIVEIMTRRFNADGPADDWGDLHLPAEPKAALRADLERLLAQGRATHIIIALEGIPKTGRSMAVRCAATMLGALVVYRDLRRARHVDPELEETMAAALLEARLADGIALFRSDGVLEGQNAARLGKLYELSARYAARCVVLVGDHGLEDAPPEVAYFRLTMPGVTAHERRVLWQQALDTAGLTIDAGDLDDIVTRYPVAPGRIFEVVDELSSRSEQHRALAVGVPAVRSALRDMTTRKLQNHGRRYTTSLTLDRLVLPEDVLTRLEELVARLRHRYQVLQRWGFAGQGVAGGEGLSVLFAGPPGTGKTATAGAIANALDIDLYVVDLSRIMSKWVGETEQNLAALFDEAEASQVALLFDEADALFGQRNEEMKQASDRFANLTVNFLLQRLERFTGLTILTTNFEKAMDRAFKRRFTATVHFPIPDREQRERLWRVLLPSTARYADDVDLGRLARKYEMPGAHIQNTILRAAYRVASTGHESPILDRAVLETAAALEYADMGRLAPR